MSPYESAGIAGGAVQITLPSGSTARWHSTLRLGPTVLKTTSYLGLDRISISRSMDATNTSDAPICLATSFPRADTTAVTWAPQSLQS